LKDRKIVSALSGLSVYELNSFSKYIHSPYFNPNERLSHIYDLIEKSIKKGNIDLLTPEEIWKSTFPDEPYINQKFLKLSSDLLTLFESFLAQIEFDHSDSLRANLKLEGIRKHSLSKLYKGIINDIERLQKLDNNQSAEFYLNRYLIEKNLFQLKTENEKKNEKVEISSELNLKNISDNLDYFYIAEKLRQYCTLLSWQKMYKLDIQLAHIENILTLAQSDQYSNIPAINMYYNMYLTYSDSSNVLHYENLKKQIENSIHLFPEHEQWEIYSTAISYCINKVNRGDISFQQDTFQLYKQVIDNNLILHEDYLSATTFRNIVQIATRVDETSWAEHFIYEYSKHVDEKLRTNAVEFSLARLEFYRKQYDKVLGHLYNVTYEDVWYNINAKTLLIATYYELDEYDALESLLQAFKMYIRRERSLPADRKIHYLNLVKFTNSLIKIHPKDKTKLSKLFQEIKDTKGVVSKPWLEEKVLHLLDKK